MIKITIKIEERPCGMNINIQADGEEPTSPELAFADCYKDMLQKLAVEIGREFPSALLIERYPEPKKER